MIADVCYFVSGFAFGVCIMFLAYLPITKSLQQLRTSYEKLLETVQAIVKKV